MWWYVGPALNFVSCTFLGDLILCAWIVLKMGGKNTHLTQVQSSYEEENIQTLKQ